MKQSVTGIGAVLLVGGLLAGCSAPAEPKAPVDATPKEEEVQAAPEENETSAAEAPLNEDGVLVPGGIASGVAKLPWINYVDAESVWSHQVVSIELAPAVDVEQIAETSPTVNDYDVWYVTIDSSYVSGEVTPHSSFYTGFYPARGNGDQLQSVSLIGFDACPSTSIGGDPTAAGMVITNCVAAAVPKGSEAPAGVIWAQHDTDYASYQGEPALLLK